MKEVAIVFGSSRTNGNTSALVSELKKNMDLTVYKLNDYSISPFDYQHENINDGFIGLIKQLLKYEHIMFATPIYWYTMSAQMKVFFDRLSDLLHIKIDLGRKLRGKSCSVISTGASPHPERSFEEVFINSFNYLSMNYKGMLYCYCEEDFKVSDHRGYIDKTIKQIMN